MGENRAKVSEYVDTIEFNVLDILNTLRIEPYLTNEDQRYPSLYGNVSCTDGK